ncbi:MAG: hypothetical protein U0Q19_23840, partial [Kineosporiaceae bacterium]
CHTKKINYAAPTPGMKSLYFRRSDLDGAALGRILVGVPDFDQDPQRWVGEEQFRREACE